MPDDAPVMVATRQMIDAFHDKGTDNVVLVVLTDEKGLSPADEGTYRTLVDKLRKDTANVVSQQDFLGTPEVREVLSSRDNKAWYLPVSLSGHAGSAEGQVAYLNAAKLIKQTVAVDPGRHLAGPAATAADLTAISERDLNVIEAGTGIMVLLILLIVYRNPLTMVMPLITIGISLATAQGVLAGLAELGLGVSSQTMVFMSGVMFGAGTDYAVFLISRYHDYVRLGEDSDRAVKLALASIGKVIAASAATVAVTFLAMVFTTLPVFSTIGPALSIAVTVAFHRGHHAVAGDHGARWAERLDQAAARADYAILANLGCAHCAPSQNPFDRKPDDSDFPGRLLGLRALQLRRSQDLAEFCREHRGLRGYGATLPVGHHHSAVPLHPVTTRHAGSESSGRLGTDGPASDQLPDVSMVRGITRPTGESLEQARLAWQAGEVGNKLNDASQQINSHTNDLDTMSDGANQLANALGDLRNQVDQALPTISGLVESLTFLQKNFGGQKTLNQIDDAAKLLSNLRSLGRPSI